jgi:copper chaperone CopZ
MSVYTAYVDYQNQGEQAMKKDVFKINTMYCPKCPDKVLNAVQGLAGIEKTLADLKKSELAVEYDEGQTNRVRIVDAVRQAGFTAKLTASPAEDAPEPFKSRSRSRAYQALAASRPKKRCGLCC